MLHLCFSCTQFFSVSDLLCGLVDFWWCIDTDKLRRGDELHSSLLYIIYNLSVLPGPRDTTNERGPVPVPIIVG